MGGLDSSIDASTWQALGLVLTVLGFFGSAVIWSRRGPADGLRAVAWSLLPLAAGLTGVLRLAWEIGRSVLDFTTRLVLSPVVWLGLVVAAVAAALFLVSGWMRRRGGSPPVARRHVATPRGAPLPGAGRSAARHEREGVSRTGSAGDDLADIDEILRKHGIQ